MAKVNCMHVLDKEVVEMINQIQSDLAESGKKINKSDIVAMGVRIVNSLPREYVLNNLKEVKE